MRNKFTPEQREQIRTENREGQSIRALATKYQVSTRTIWKAINEEKLAKQRLEAAAKKVAEKLTEKDNQTPSVVAPQNNATKPEENSVVSSLQAASGDN